MPGSIEIMNMYTKYNSHIQTYKYFHDKQKNPVSFFSWQKKNAGKNYKINGKIKYQLKVILPMFIARHNSITDNFTSVSARRKQTRSDISPGPLRC